MQSWCRTWPLNGSSRIRAKQKLHRKHREACKSSWSPLGSLKSFTLTILWNAAKLVKISLGIIARLHHTDRRLMVLPKEQCAEWEKVRLLYCCNQVWMTVGGQIPWNVTFVFETSPIYCLMGRRHMKDVLGNHLKDRYSIWFICWVSPFYFEGPVKNSSIGKESLISIVSRIRIVRAGEFGRVTYWLQTLRSWRRWTHRKSTQERCSAKEVIFPSEKDNLFFQSQMDESNTLEEIKTWKHPLWYGSDRFKEKVTFIFLEN